jgi:hypothetical protein
MLVLSLLSLTALAPLSPAQDPAALKLGREISTRMWHLGNDPTPEWSEAPVDPDGSSISLKFNGEAFDGPGLLYCRQRNVDNAWFIQINGQRIATLDRGADLKDHYYAIPAGLIVDGENSFTLAGDTPTDDITFGDLRYYPFSFRQLFDLRPVSVRVLDESGSPSPARITITDQNQELVRVFFAERLHTAVRNGVVYTSDGVANFEIARGTDCWVQASRGTEWSWDGIRLTVDGNNARVDLQLKREVQTDGFVAADTHIHTLTHSGHGDASVEERMVTLAGEGVELAIATDHNHNIDYRPTQDQMGLNAYFTPVVGNEVTTPIGHFNAFPLRPEDPVPAHDLEDIVKLVDGMRAAGAKAVILNHPRWPDHQNSPHGHIQLNHQSGDWVGDWTYPVDAMELINSQTEELQPMLLFQDWFALLNRGERVFAVASSDSHTVGGVVGQGRTYVMSSTDDPSQIDIDETALNIAHGHSSISMGIFIDVRAAGKSAMGETLPEQDLELRIAAPSWANPRRLTVYANGQKIYSQELKREFYSAELKKGHKPAPFDQTISLPTSLKWPGHDYWMVTVVEGDGVGAAWWPQLNNYTLAATNPVFVDQNGDGKYLDPRSLAQAVFTEMESGSEGLMKLVNVVDSAVAVQIMRLVRLDLLNQAEAKTAELARSFADLHPELLDWIDSLDVSH